MAITLSPDLESRVQEVVASGRFASVEQAMEYAVDQLLHDPLSDWSKEDLETAVNEGLWSLEHEPLVTPEEARASLAQLRAELRRE